MEIAQYFVQILGPVGISLYICLKIMKNQQEQNETLLNFMLDQIRKQTEILDVIKQDMIILKEEIKTIKEQEELK